MRNFNNQPLAAILLEFTQSPKLKKPLYTAKIQGSWEKLMGKSISSFTKSISINRNILYITIESASLRNELSYGKEKILQLVNEELGEAYLKNVVVQ